MIRVGYKTRVGETLSECGKLHDLHMTRVEISLFDEESIGQVARGRCEIESIFLRSLS